MDSDGDFVVAWQTYPDSGENVRLFIRRFSKNGSPLGPDELIGVGSYSDASISITPDGRHVLAYYGRGGIRARIYDASGTAVGSEITVNSSGTVKLPSVALHPSGHFTIVWQDTNGTTRQPYTSGVSARRFNAAGDPLGPQFRVNSTAGGGYDLFPVVAMLDPDSEVMPAPVVAWTDLVRIRWQLYDTYSVSPGDATIGGVAWHDEDANGIRENHEAPLAGISVDLRNPFGVLVASTVTDAQGAYQFPGVAAGGAYRIEFRNTAYVTTLRDVGSDDTIDNDALRGVITLVAPAGGTRLDYDAGFAMPAQVVARVYSDFDSDGVYDPGEIEMKGWIVFEDDDNDGIFDAGEPSGATGLDGTFTFTGLHPGLHHFRAVRQSPWSAVTPAAELTVAAGDAVGLDFGFHNPRPPTRVMPAGPAATVAITSGVPVIGSDAEGNYVVPWTGLDDGSGSGIFAARYNPAGARLGDVFLINTNIGGAQYAPALAMARDGRFIITWTSEGQDGGGAGIYAQRFSAAGLPEGSEFRVNTTTGDQISPCVAISSGGQFVIGWGQYSGNNLQYFFQRYASDGTPEGLETAVAGGVSTRSHPASIGMIPRFFDEKGCLKLVFATLWRASQRWRAVRFTEMEKRPLEAYIRVRRAMGKNVRSLVA